MISKCWLTKAKMLALALALAVLLSGCSHTTVHLYKRYLSDEQIAAITTDLQNNGFEVEQNDHQFPDGMHTSSILYSPHIPGTEKIDAIAAVLKQYGFPVYQYQPLTVSNHWYTKNSIGVFPLPDDVNPEKWNTVADLSHTYQASDCDSSGSITLQRDGQLTIALSGQTTRGGNWQITSYPYVSVDTEDLYHLAFEMNERLEQDQVSQIRVLTLTPLSNYQILAGCTFEYGVRI